jgi:hypothetical protein
MFTGKHTPTGGYVLWSDGRVEPLDGAHFYGDARSSGFNNFVGMATDYLDPGYWLVTSSGKVFAFGGVCPTVVKAANAPRAGVVGVVDLVDPENNEGFAMITSTGKQFTFTCPGLSPVATVASGPTTRFSSQHGTHIIGAWANGSEQWMIYIPTGGYVLWSNGRVTALNRASFYGDARASGLNNFVGLVSDYGSEGYWLVTSSGKVFAFGPTCSTGGTLTAPKSAPSSNVIGVIDQGANNNEGFAMITSSGKRYNFSCEVSLAP